MGRVSVKKNKNPYQLARERLGLTREKASEVLVSVPPERIEKIESERSLAHPDEVLVMSEGYKKPALCNYYCSRECPIGRRYVPEIEHKELSQIVLEMIAALNAVHKKRDRLIEISVDGRVNEDEIEDFVAIRNELERVSVTTEALQLWFEELLANSEADTEAYNRYNGTLNKYCSPN